MWFDAYLKCETVAGLDMGKDEELWFDAYLKCETVVCELRYRRTGCDLMLIWNVKQLATISTTINNELWFDAYLKCETVGGASQKRESQLWFDAYLKCETVRSRNGASRRSCDLMLIWNVKQLIAWYTRGVCCCDLMLIWNVKQYDCKNSRLHSVVIWCLFEMWNSKKMDLQLSALLWFDAYLKCETVGFALHIQNRCCDLMLIWNVKQYNQLDDIGGRMFVIWCLFEMWNSL